jgi:hypothetical protein
LRKRHHVGDTKLTQFVHLVQKGPITEPCLGLDYFRGSHGVDTEDSRRMRDVCCFV